ncbi:MerR family DNA-binding transcriptional regulator [Microbispora sp. NPDC049633]|uniref:MerR family DNA-binding transcriptional regulator n=1 Tax=Microbispora sp. NPDC049633 TaxID=3154355 RepID=UPI003423941C
MKDSVQPNVGMKSSATIGIGEAAARFGLATHVLRHWEYVGLLTPSRVAGDRPARLIGALGRRPGLDGPAPYGE